MKLTSPICCTPGSLVKIPVGRCQQGHPAAEVGQRRGDIAENIADSAHLAARQAIVFRSDVQDMG
jgi:hypothetical protein